MSKKQIKQENSPRKSDRNGKLGHGIGVSQAATPGLLRLGFLTHEEGSTQNTLKQKPKTRKWEESCVSAWGKKECKGMLLGDSNILGVLMTGNEAMWLQ